MENFKKLLVKNGYQCTEKRRIIFKVLCDNKKEHLDAKEILCLSQKEDESIGIATIYRTLDLFNNLGIISSVDNKYELNNNNSDGIYPHFICNKCKKIIFVGNYFDIEKDLLNMAKLNDFKVNTINLNINGVCRSCYNKISNT